MTTLTTPVAPVTRTEITDARRRLRFIPRLFATPLGDTMVANFLHQYSHYDGGLWRYWEVPRGLSGHVGGWTEMTTRPTGYITPPEGDYRLTLPGNYFEGTVSAEAAGIIGTLFVLNRLAWKASAMGREYAPTCQGLVDRQDALKDYVSIVRHPEASLIFRAID